MTSIITPIYKLANVDSNNIYIKRDDLLPFSFGGNKVRIAKEFIDDAISDKSNCIIGYGNVRSNLCRVLSNLSYQNRMKCVIVSPKVDDTDNTCNSNLVKNCGATIVSCEHNNVADTIESVLNDCKEQGFIPYYINGDKYGKGNEKVPVRAYFKVFKEISRQEKDFGVRFDYIFHASGTGMTQSGLVCGLLDKKDYSKKIIGISIARSYENQLTALTNYIMAGIEENSISMNKEIKDYINFCDLYLKGGYGKYDDELIEFIKKIYCEYGIPLDLTYTGKALFGTMQYLKENNIKNKNILFLHTGGTPLFFDDLMRV